jgi:tetratricopeptide (TPR) repeat protein
MEAQFVQPGNYTRILRFALLRCFARLAFLLSLSALVLLAASPRAQQSVPSTGSQLNTTSIPSAGAPSMPDPVAAAEASISGSDWKGAESKLDSWLASHPTDARALFDAGYVADAQNRLDDAAVLYRRAIETDPQSFEAHLSLGLLLARQGKTGEAHPELVTSTALDPGVAGPELKARAWRALARIDQDSNASQASADLIEALKLSPETSADTLLAAQIAEQAGQLDAAEKAYRRVLEADAKSIPADAGLAHILIVRKEYPKAETLLRAALNQAPDDPTLSAQLATVLAAQDKAEALPLLQNLHAAHPADAAISRMLASVMADAGNYAGSDELDVHLLAASPDDSDLLLAHAQNLVHQGLLAQAYLIFDKTTRLAPDSIDAWSGLAFTASRTNRPDVTLHALTVRSEHAPETASTLFLWATAYDSLRQKPQAAAYYHRFLDAAAGKFPNQEWQARQRLQILEK